MATTRRMRINVTKNTKGYSYDTTFEITSDDPDFALGNAMEDGLQNADRIARSEISSREYTDAHGLPGADEYQNDKPF